MKFMKYIFILIVASLLLASCGPVSLEKVEDYNPYEIGESISKTILNQLSFLEVNS